MSCRITMCPLLSRLSCSVDCKANMTGSKKKTNMAAHGPTQTCIAGANSGFNTDPNTAGGQTAASQQAGHDQLPRQGAASALV